LNFVFCKEDGMRLRERTMQTAFERLKKTSKVPNIKIHDLRHTHAVMLLEAEVSLKEIQERLGHKDIMTTGNIYSHVTKSMEANQ
jgi:site-specific recombinase XerD